MSVLTRHRLYLACALLLAATAVLADAPPSLNGARIVYNPKTTYSYLFGGSTILDAGTQQTYDQNATWVWVGDHWVHIFPADAPPPRSLQAMTYDSRRDVIVLFGGRHTTYSNTGVAQLNYFADTWEFDGNDWQQVSTATAPSARMAAAMAFDPSRGVSVLFGGASTTTDGVTSTKDYDTWEYDGTNWVETNTSGPQLDTPSLVYDEARSQLVLVGYDSNGKTQMFHYDPAQKSWVSMTPTTLPDCANGATMVYERNEGKILLYGGTCPSSTTTGDNWVWDGSNWAKTAVTIPRLTGEAIAYDAQRITTVMFGGTVAFSTYTSNTYLFHNNAWTSITGELLGPAPRSLFGFVPDPVNGGVWLYSGINDNAQIDDFWKYHNGTWEALSLDNGPKNCVTPNVAFDKNRSRLVVLCADQSLYEYDGSTWKQIQNLKTQPRAREFSAMTYDETVKKIVLFGGYDPTLGEYLDETWLWDGTSWTQQKNNRPPRRFLTSIWFDPVLKKSVIFGGIGQATKDDRITRFNDMWSFDGTGWTQITTTGTNVPTARYGALTAVDPLTNTVLLFGGLRLEVSGVSQKQLYSNDTWSWDGSKWTQLQPATVPPVRENGGIAFDSTASEMVMFGGYSGWYLGDRWTWNGSDWVSRADPLPASPILPNRRRGTPSPPPPPATP